ncbi:DUF3341 domain-containing protein [Chloroflexia bacterium SDU3-3]|nr:DUF3341 domain-containing protein [Chloroflexia bacterium SDU3-3]
MQNIFRRGAARPAPAAAAPAPLYGLVGEFRDADALLHAAEAAEHAGYTKLDAFSPFPIEELAEAVGHKKDRLPAVVLTGGLTGAVFGFGLQWLTQVIDYPLVVFGRPPFAWPAYIPITFECTILFAAFSAVFGMVLMNGLPQPYHPMFNAPDFERASQDKFFLVIEARDPKFDLQKTRAFLSSQHAIAINEVQQ